MYCKVKGLWLPIINISRFQLGDIPPAPRGVPQIEVSFDIDVNGIVNVSAKDLGTGKSQKITIQDNTGLSEEEIERMVKEAEENAEADKARKDEADLRNESEQIIFATKKALTDLEKEVTNEEKEEVESKISTLEEALKTSDLDKIKNAKEELIKASQGIATKAYQKAQQTTQTNSASETSEEDDGAVKGEFVEEDENENQ